MKKVLKQLRQIIEHFVDFILETIIPSDPDVRRIQLAGTAAFQGLLKNGPGEYASCLFLLPYRDPAVKAALIELKTNPNKKIARIVGQIFFEALVRIVEADANIDVKAAERLLVLPIPITAQKKRERGWNQCELILDGFVRASNAAGQIDRFSARKDILIKSRENADQVGRSRAQRFENLKDCFAIRNPGDVNGRIVIVFDDILTTGATLGDARRALDVAGAREIICVAIAH